MVVGAGSIGPGWGNGKATAVTFAREGAQVACVDLNLAADSCGWDAIDVHIRALQLLRAHGQSLSPQHREAVLSGLSEVVVKQFGSNAAA